MKKSLALLALLATSGLLMAQNGTDVTVPAVGLSFSSILRGLLGMGVIIGLAWLLSSNRRAINWSVVAKGLGLQVVLAFSILYLPFVQGVFDFVGRVFVKILSFTEAGTEFLFSSMLSGEIESSLVNFAITILPTIIFFSALTSILFYYGVIQKVVYFLALGMTKLLRLSGAESLSVAGNIFLGQTESPLMIKAYLEKMNRSEMLLVMAGGMATLAGGVLAVYIKVLGGGDPAQELLYAKHLLAASIMAAPGVVVVAKMMLPQTENIEKEVEVSKDRIGKNVLDAISNGTTEGVRLAVNVAGMLLVFIAFIAMFNYIFGWLGNLTGLNALIASATHGSYDQLSLQFLLGYLFAPPHVVAGCTGCRHRSGGPRTGRKTHHDRIHRLCESRRTQRSRPFYARQIHYNGHLHTLRLCQRGLHRHTNRRHRLPGPRQARFTVAAGCKSPVGRHPGLPALGHHHRRHNGLRTPLQQSIKKAGVRHLAGHPLFLYDDCRLQKGVDF